MTKKKQVLYPVLFMIIVTVIFTTTLAIINEMTIDRIHALEETKQKQTLLYIFGLESSKDQEKVNEEFKKYITDISTTNQIVYQAVKDDQVLGYAFEISGSGLWGTIKGYAAINQDYSQILGVDFVSHSETPGLGGRISELWFKEQFRNVSIAPTGSDSIIYRPESGGNVDAITGATLTSVAVKNIINNDIRTFITNNEGGF